MVRTLWDILGEIEDRRGRQGRQYALRSVCAVLCSGQGAVDMALFAKAKEPFLRSFLKLENGLPSRRRSAGSSVSSIRRSSKQPFSGSWQEFLFNVRP